MTDEGAAPVAAASPSAGERRYTLAPYRPELRDAYLGLLAEAWGPQAMSDAEFDWWFAGNPAGSLMSVAELEGRVVGVASHSLARIVLGGEETLGQFSVHATTDRSARGLGIFKALELRHEEEGAARGSRVVLAFASAPTSPLFTGPLGWTAIDPRRVWLRPLAGVARRLPRRGGSTPGTGTASGSPAGLAPPEGREWRVGRVEVQRVERFGAAVDAAYRAAAPRLGNHVVRDATYLNWRFLDSPRGYRAFASPSGFAVLGHKLMRGVSLAVVAECVAPPREARALLRRCIVEARGAEAIAVVPPVGLSRELLFGLGFVPSHISLDFMGKALPGMPPLDARSGAWRVSLGDTDFF